MNENYLLFIYKNIRHQISRTDTKANIILAIQLGIFGYFFIRLDSLKFCNYINIILLSLFSIFSLLVLIYTGKTIWPRLSSKYPEKTDSLIYFKHILDLYMDDKDETIKKLSNLGNKKFKKDLINQIISLSYIANNKYRCIQKSFIFITMELPFFFLILLNPLLSIK